MAYNEIRNFYLNFFGMTLGVVLLVIIANVLVDPYDVLETHFLPYYGQPNERYLKIEHIKEIAPETVLLGSSRVGTMKPVEFQQRLGGGRFYNLSVAQANQWDNLQHVRWMVSNLPSLKRIVIQVDWPDSYGKIKPGFPLISRMHPDVIGESRLAFKLAYLSAFSPSALRAKIENYRRPETRIRYNMEQGYWEQPIIACAGLPIQKASPSSNEVRQSIDRNMEALRETIRISSEHNVVVLLFVSPHSATQLDSFNIEDFVYFLQRLAEVSPYMNFAYYSDFTLDGCNYYEESHYRSDKAAKVMDQIAGLASGSEIGIRVERGSVNEEIVRIRSNFMEHRRRRHQQ